MARVFKAMSATNPTAGGFLIPEVYLDEVIELLYSKTVIKELGARTIPLENGNLNIPRMTSGTRAMWGGEGRKIASTQPAFGNLRLSAKRLEAIVPQTRELLMSTKYSADELFAADLSRRMQLGLDWGALYGTGGEFQPTGIANTPGVEKIDAKKMDAQYAADGRLTADFPVYVKSLVMSKNVDDQALGWAFNSFMEGYLKNIKTTTGDYIYRDEVDKAVAAYKKEHGKNPSWMPNQYFAALTNMRSVGVMGDERTYDYAVALRAVNTVDFMTAESAEIPFAVLQTVMSRIINEVRGVNRVFYDLTSKPPGTIEFE